jgi:hypothetical protein
VLRTHINYCSETRDCLYNLQRGTIRWRRWHSWKEHGHSIEEMVLATVRMGEHVRTMGRQAATVVFPDSKVLASVIVIVIASWGVTAAVE